MAARVAGTDEEFQAEKAEMLRRISRG